jgi:hypothetical protein
VPQFLVHLLQSLLPVDISNASPAPLNKGTSAKRAVACFIAGTIALPTEVSDTAIAIQNNVTCNLAKTTIGKAPDVTSGGITFSSIDFSQSSLTPLNFALTTFATADPLASSDLDTFTNQLNTYLATGMSIAALFIFLY